MLRSAIALIRANMPKRGGRPWKAVSLALILCGLGLAGCYSSAGLLLDGDEAVQPLADGVYVRDGDPADRFELTQTAGGGYRVERFNRNGTIGETHPILLTPMALDDGRAAFAVAAQTDDGYAYAVAIVSDGRVQLATPDCADPFDLNLAVDQGGEADDDGYMTPACKFRNRAALISALAAFAGQADFGRPYQRH